MEAVTFLLPVLLAEVGKRERSAETGTEVAGYRSPPLLVL